MKGQELTAALVFRQGAALMLFGVLETIRSEARSAATMGVIGAMWGIGVGVVKGESLIEHAIKSAKTAGRWGIIWGWQGASSQYNDYAHKRGLPTVKWYDNVLSSIFAYKAYKQDTPFRRMEPGTALVMTQIMNPITMMGARTVGKSAIMALGS